MQLLISTEKRRMTGSLFLILLVCAHSATHAAAFARKTSHASISVSPVISYSDVLALADLRYNEWIATDDHSTGTISANAFRMATAEIHEERKSGGAIAFLARLTNSGGEAAVGAAELSPIEFENTYAKTTTGKDKTTTNALYVTDVVSSSSHRRMGVGGALMTSLEQEAARQGIGRLFLHVEEDNAAALDFYRSREYGFPGEDVLEEIDTDRLAENAGTVGQILMSKVLSKQQMISSSSGIGSKGGFGSNKTKPKQKQKQKKRKK